MGEGLIVVDNDDRSKFVNRKCCEIYGYESEELIGKIGYEVLEHKEDRHIVIEKTKIRKQGITDTYELRGVKKNGEIIIVRINGAPIYDIDNKVIGSIGIVSDITKIKNDEELLRNSEEKFRTFVENANDIVYSLTPEGIFTYVSPSWTKILGHEISEVENHSFTEFIHKDDIEPCLKYLEKTILTEKPQGVIEYRVRHKDGSWRIHTSNSSVKRDETGKVINFLGIARDITDRKIVEKKLRESEANLKELNATKDKFFNIIAHDLRNPFNAIVGYSSLLVNDLQEEKYKDSLEFAQIILKSSNAALNLLSNLLEWSRSQTGKIKFKPEILNLNEVINEAIESALDYAEQKSIEAKILLPENISVYADKDMLSSVLRNLISNAIKFTNKGGTINVEAVEKPDEILVSIRDNGIGIKQQVLENLFRLDINQTITGTEGEKGTGLGLLLCKEFVEKHNGKIWVESEPGKGSKFFFTLPKA